MNEHSRNNDSRIVVKFPALSKKPWSSSQRENKPPTKEACTPCSVLLLNDASLNTKSLQEFDEQWAVCVKKCLKRRVSKNSKIFDNSHLSKTARKDTPVTEKYQVVLKEEPPSPQPDPTDNTIQEKSSLPQHLQNTRQMKTRNTDPNKLVTVEVKVELVESNAKDASIKTKKNKQRGVNRDFLIKGTAEKWFDSLNAPIQCMSKTAATKLGRIDSIDNTKITTTTLQQLNSKTAIVQPRMSSATSTVNPVTNVQTSTVPSASCNLLTPRETQSILPGVVNVDMSKLSSSGTSSVIKAGDQTTISPTPTPSVQSTDGMCILQLMNGQMVLLPIDTVRQLSANISSPLVQTCTTSNILNIPTIYPLNPGTTDPFMSPLVQPGITYLAPTGPNLVPPTITPQICNFAPRLVGQQTLTNPIVYMPQTSNPNTTLIWQQNNKQANIISSPNILPSSVQIPNVLSVAQPPVYPVVSAPKPATPTVNSKPISNTSYLRLADGQLVPIINGSAILGANKPSTTAVKHEDGGVTTVTFSAHSGLPLTNSVLSANVPTVNPVQYVPTAPPPPRPPPAINGPANQGSPRFLQFPNGSLVPIVDQNVSCTNNQTRVIFQTSASVPVQQTMSVQSNTTRSAITANVPVKQALSAQSNTTRGAMTASQLVKKHIQNSKMRSIRPAPQNVKMASINEAQQSHVLEGSTHQNGPRFQESIIQILNTKTDLFQSEDSSRDTTGLLKKPAPSILNSNKSKETNETSNPVDTTKPFSGPQGSPRPAKNRNAVSLYALAPKPDQSRFIPATPTNSGVSNPPKTGSKRKSVNIVREDFDARKKTKSRRVAQKPTGRTYFTQEVIDVDEEEERKKKAGKDGRPQFMFMRSVSKPEFRPVLLDSTIEEKGLRLPDSMVI